MKLTTGKLFASLSAGLALNIAQAETIVGDVSAHNGYGPIEGASITVLDNGIRTASDEQGKFVIQNIAPGTYALRISYLGLGDETVSVTVEEGGIATLSAELGRDIVDLDPFVVTGVKSASARALNLQRNSSNLVNTVASDALGQFPDENAAEALQRVSGVSIERDQGEGRYVVIRGIDSDLNNISLDGVALASPEGDTRKVALDVIPTDLLDQLEIRKTFLPDMDGDAIGGSVNIKTLSPFDQGERFASAKAQLLYNDLVDETSFMFAGTYTDTFGSEGNSGYVVSTSYQEREFGSDNIEVDGPWSASEEAEDGSTGFFAPEIEFRQYDVTRERKSLSLNFEHLPNDTTRLYARGTYNYFSDEEYRHRTEIKPERGTIETLSDTTASVTGANKTDRDLKDRFEEQEILAFSLGGETRVDDWRFNYKASLSTAEENEPDRLDTDFRNGEDSDFSYDFSNSFEPRVTVDGGSDIFDPANFELDEFVAENNLTEEEEIALKFDAMRFLDFGDNPGFVKFGFKYRTKDKNRDNDVAIYSWDGDGDTPTAAGLTTTGSRYPYLTGGSAYLQYDPQAVRNLFNSEFSNLQYDDESDIDSTLADYDTTEDVLAAYGMAEIETGKWTITGGARVEQTDFETTGFELVTWEEEIDGEIEELYELNRISSDNDYTDILLSLNSRYALDDTTIIRASASNTIARPKFSDSSISTETNRTDEEVERGNPNLDPYESINLDLSFEKYNEKLGLFAANVFYKDIDSFVYMTNFDNADGFKVSTPQNGENATILGLELIWNQELGLLAEALQGFSIDTNLTFSNADAIYEEEGEEAPLLKQPEEIFNLTLSYENEHFMFRLAGTHRGEYLDSAEGDPIEDEYVDSHFQLDAKAVYKIDEQSSVFLEMINLNDEPFQAYYGSPSRMRQFETYSFSAKLGYSWKL
ncbi:TonB-dependent receptor [Pelagicoccus mobilis]|uniref:TonB-dependent receptor n=1 Tax=Pelagicoccus mobilis TaxID=415221 RepID=A0A934VQD9_9BACT|nr:TonB-dependent receptor [Pelagicoccus mobilis]MBK1876394.1 TonB-dependent receptor [Pelagicoccus mobilis]